MNHWIKDILHDVLHLFMPSYGRLKENGACVSIQQRKHFAPLYLGVNLVRFGMALENREVN